MIILQKNKNDKCTKYHIEQNSKISPQILEKIEGYIFQDSSHILFTTVLGLILYSATEMMQSIKASNNKSAIVNRKEVRIKNDIGSVKSDVAILTTMDMMATSTPKPPHINHSRLLVFAIRKNEIPHKRITAVFIVCLRII